MRAIRSLLGLLVGLVVVGGLASAAAAAMTKRQMASRGTEDDDEVDLVVIFDGLEFASRAPAFRRGSILTWYGGATVDLSDATLDPAGATLDVRTMFGGLQLLVPPSWRVDLQLVAVFAGVADTRDPDAVATDGPRLLVTGWAIAGGVGVMTSDLAADEPVARAAEAGAGG
jgi:hypothetical protein